MRIKELKRKGVFAKVNQVLIGPLSGFIDFQLRSIIYEVSGEIAGPSSFSVNDNFLFFNPKAGLTYTISNRQKLYASYEKLIGSQTEQIMKMETLNLKS